MKVAPMLTVQVQEMAAQVPTVVGEPGKDVSGLAPAGESAGQSDKDRIAQLERDLRDLRGRLSEMTRLAYIDSLSGLANRRAFDDEMLRTVDRARRYEMPAVVAVFDIDRFKEVNDLYGHVAGDAMIIAIGQCLRSQIRASDFVARIGGDEFAVILSNIPFEDACQRVELLSEAVGGIEYKVAGEILRISVSVGTSAIETRIGNDALREADQAMYRRKRAARTIYTV